MLILLSFIWFIEFEISVDAYQITTHMKITQFCLTLSPFVQRNGGSFKVFLSFFLFCYSNENSDEKNYYYHNLTTVQIFDSFIEKLEEK